LGNIFPVWFFGGRIYPVIQAKITGQIPLPGEAICEVLFIISVLCLFLINWYGYCVTSGGTTSLQDETMCTGTAK
jgi:hypothetical protein